MLSTISMFPQVMHMCNRIEVVQSWYRRPGYKLKYICITTTCRLHALASNSTGQHHAPPPCTAEPLATSLSQAAAAAGTRCSCSPPGQVGTPSSSNQALRVHRKDAGRAFWWWPPSPSLLALVKTFLAGCLAAPPSSSGSTHCQDPPGSSCTLSSWSRRDISATIKHN